MVNNSLQALKEKGNDGLIKVNEVAKEAQSSKELATIQGQIFMAKQFPRDNDIAMKRIQSMCERTSMAQIAEYEYTRGGTTVKGASIKLIEAIAQNYGNVTWSWKEIERNKEYSKVMAYAWDLETNSRVELEFIVALKRDKKVNGVLKSELVTSERDIYEVIANNAQRRVRKCLEGIIPRDIVEQALEWCNETINTKVNIQDAIDKAINYLNENYGVTLAQIEAKYGMNRRAFTKNTYLSLQKTYVSIRDGVQDVNEAFPPIAKKDVKNPLSNLGVVEENQQSLQVKDENKDSNDIKFFDVDEEKMIEDSEVQRQDKLHI